MQPPEADVLSAAVALGRALRQSGVPAGLDDELTLCRALGEVDVRRRAQVYWAARATLVRCPDHLPVFDELFERFWAGRELIPGPVLAEHGESDPRMPGAQHGGESLPQFRLEGRSEHVLDGGTARALREIATASTEPGSARDGRRRGVLAAYSPEDVPAGQDGAPYRPDELALLRQMARTLAAHAPQRRSRRLRAGRRRDRLDVRRTVRAALRTDGEALRLAYSTRSLAPRRLLLLCDVSGSMDRYSRGLLATLQAVVAAGLRAETFVFATRLTRLTPDLRGYDASAVLEHARRAVGDWSSGTRIGDALAEFNRTWARRGHARGAVVIVVSDGWDCGDPDSLRREVERLRLQARRLVWVNPRPADLDGQPIALGMRAVAPLVDDLVRGHDHRSIGRLLELICTLDERRPARPQRPVGWARA